MLIVYILIISIIVGYLTSLKKKRLPTWLYVLTAFLGALVGAGLSLGDSVVLLSYPVLNAWTVPAVISIAFSFVVFFADRGKTIGIVFTVIVVFMLVGVLVYLDSEPSDYDGLFREELNSSRELESAINREIMKISHRMKATSLIE